MVIRCYSGYELIGAVAHALYYSLTFSEDFSKKYHSINYFGR